MLELNYAFLRSHCKTHPTPILSSCHGFAFFTERTIFQTVSSSQDWRSGESIPPSNVFFCLGHDTMTCMWVEFPGPLLSSESLFFGYFGFPLSLKLKPYPNPK